MASEHVLRYTQSGKGHHGLVRFKQFWTPYSPYIQKQPLGEMRPVAMLADPMSETKCGNYEIEKEDLAITWALER